MSETKKHNYKNHKAITEFHIRQRREFREKLSEDELKEVSLYFDEENHFVNGNTPLTIPEKYKILIKDRYFCKWCEGYHAARKGSYLCPKNPDYKKNVRASKEKAKARYINGRKMAIKNGNNIHYDENVKRAEHLNEYLRNHPEVVKAAIKKSRQNRSNPRADIIRARKAWKEKAALKKEMQQLEGNYKSHDLFSMMNSINQIKKTIDNFNSIDFRPITTYDETTGRHYDSNGDFDPFS